MIRFKAMVMGCCLLGWGGIAAYAQSNVMSSGGEAVGAGGTVNYSIGQTDYITVATGAGIITQGVQQPFEILTVGLNSPSILLNALAYPNPVSHLLMLDIGPLDFSGMSYTLSEASGKVVDSKEIHTGLTYIDMSTYSQGMYYITVSEKNQELKSFQILKNN